jgi:small subunit ribosomal protein S3
VGQKTNPNAFRLVSNHKHLSNWYGFKNEYSLLIKEDTFLREHIEKNLEGFLTLSSIEISRTILGDSEKAVIVTLNALHPRFKDMYKQVLTFFEKENKASKIQKYLGNPKRIKGKLKPLVIYMLRKKIRDLTKFLKEKTNKYVFFKFKFIKNMFEDAQLIAKFVGSQLKKRIPFRRIIKQTIKKVLLTSIKGIKIEVSGRLNGVEIARSEWKREGKIPLHTLKAFIDYSSLPVETVYGILGVKVWLFKE